MQKRNVSSAFLYRVKSWTDENNRKKIFEMFIYRCMLLKILWWIDNIAQNNNVLNRKLSKQKETFLTESWNIKKTNINTIVPSFRHFPGLKNLDRSQINIFKRNLLNRRIIIYVVFHIGEIFRIMKGDTHTHAAPSKSPCLLSLGGVSIFGKRFEQI